MQKSVFNDSVLRFGVWDQLKLISGQLILIGILF